MPPRATVENRRKTIALDGSAPQPLTPQVMAEARTAAPNLVPITLGTAPSFGFGDRIGLATPGHVEAMKRAGSGIEPMFPQQSIREMARTDRQPQEVMDDAQFGMLLAGWTGRTGADADHLKTREDVDRTLAAGFPFFTIDPSDHVDEKTDGYDENTLRKKFAAVRDQIDWYGKYKGGVIDLGTGARIEFTEEVCMRCAVKYGPAINMAVDLAAYIDKVNREAGLDYEIELSVDETDQPTTLAEHYIIADQCFGKGMKLVSLAPRFIGDFEKGVDYKGDLEALEKSIADHSEICEMMRPYKLSLHSGSDKISMYAAFARATKGRFHVKTAGTSYLEALRVVARHDETTFRRIIGFARDRYPADKATYHVSATVADAPAASEVTSVVDLERIYLEKWEDVPAGRGFTHPGRQILHCTFGSVLTHPDLGPTVHGLLADHLGTYTEVLAEHFTRHLEPLRAGL